MAPEAQPLLAAAIEPAHGVRVGHEQSANVSDDLRGIYERVAGVEHRPLIFILIIRVVIVLGKFPRVSVIFFLAHARALATPGHGCFLSLTGDTGIITRSFWRPSLAQTEAHERTAIGKKAQRA